MKIRIVFLAMLLPFVAAFGKEDAGEKARRAKEVMDEFRVCMESLDEGKMSDLADRSNQLVVQVKELCKKGERDEAYDMVMSAAEELMKHDIADELNKCLAIVPTMGNPIPFYRIMKSGAHKNSANVCDDPRVRFSK